MGGAFLGPSLLLGLVFSFVKLFELELELFRRLLLAFLEVYPCVRSIVMTRDVHGLVE
jgi:hypothetical protein